MVMCSFNLVDDPVWIKCIGHLEVLFVIMKSYTSSPATDIEPVEEEIVTGMAISTGGGSAREAVL